MIIILLFRDKLYFPPDTNSFRHYHLASWEPNSSLIQASRPLHRKRNIKNVNIIQYNLGPTLFASPSLVVMIHENQDHPND